MTIHKPNIPNRDLKTLESKQERLTRACQELSSDLHASQPNLRKIQNDCEQMHKCADDLERAVKSTCKKCCG